MMTNLLKDLQKKNFYDVMEKMASTPGWSILEENNLLALKSEVNIPLINFVWGDPTQKNIEKIKSFYPYHAFTWLLTSEQNSNPLIQAGFEFSDSSPEMVLNLEEYQIEAYPANIQAVKVNTPEELNRWAQVASKSFSTVVKELEAFFDPLIKIAGVVPFLIYDDGVPTSTSLVYCDNHIAGIYSMSTLEQFRRKGLGRIALQACLDEAKKSRITVAVLYSSSMGLPLYKKSGFQITQVLQEYTYMNKSNEN